MSSPALRSLAAALLLAAAPAAAAAQDVSAIPAGERLRIRTDAGRATYRLVATAGDTIVATRDGREAPERIPLARVQRLELSLGRHSRARGFGRGATIGGLAGAGVGVAAGVAVADEEDIPGFAPLVAGVAAVVYGATGALVGGLVGMAVPGERWAPVDAARRVTVAPMRGGLGVRVAF